MRILVLSPYQAASHRLWIDQLVEGFHDIEWRILSLPARHFHWRIRSNPLSWYLGGQAAGAATPDLILATSMTDLATFKGLFHKRLGNIPAIVYFHENQFAYPVTPGVASAVEPAMVNLYSALAADRVVFNSEYNRRSFLDGAKRFLSRIRERLPLEKLQDIREKSEVIPVPVRDAFFACRPAVPPDPTRLVWNHRWEYDKGPDTLLAAVSWLAERGVSFRLELAGQRFRRAPDSLTGLVRRFGRRQVRDVGYLDEPDYVPFIARGGIVLSTALHEFQGLAVMEAAAAGCTPLVPDRLVYPEWFGERYRYASCTDPAEEGRALGRRIMEMLEAGGTPEPPSMGALRFEELARYYRALFNAVV
ncbi:MAG: DUF3524 domain-containing protein [Gammaproteobacteria bacterium]|nr:DUF3524 domain-containing protein [Gammaproteobacteria bacterium]